MSKLSGIIRRLFLLLYVIYAVSPMVGDVNGVPAGGITAERASAIIKLLVVDRAMAALFDSPGGCAEDHDASDDFFVKKFRSLPGGNSLGKQMFSESHTEASRLSEQPDLTSLQTGIVSHDIISIPAPEPFDGYGTQHSGLAPPYLLS
jgi:hypothetical protein